MRRLRALISGGIAAAVENECRDGNDDDPQIAARQSRQSAPGIPSHRPDGESAIDTVPRRPSSYYEESCPSSRRTFSCASSANYPAYSLHLAGDKPLPPLPFRTANSPSGSVGRRPSERSVESSGRSSHYSDGSGSLVAGTTPSFSFTSPTSTQYSAPSEAQHGDQRSQLSLELCLKSLVVSQDKRINNSVYYLDMSSTSSTLATKHGNNIVKVWSLATGGTESVIKFSSYTEAQSRSRDYLIRSHAILSETSSLVAIATRFGRSVEIWNWERKKRLQTLDNADRWSVGKVEVCHRVWGRLATYQGRTGVIDLFAATTGKKPFVKMKSIRLAEASLPFVPQYPELALSPTSPLLVAAAGPRPPRRGQPPPDRETLLVAWHTHDNGLAGSKPYRVARPWQHREIDTAIPSDLATYGSVVVSIWIPATFRAVPAPAAQAATGSNYKLAPVQVSSRNVLVWDLAASSTRTFAIPNCTSCISPDCRPGLEQFDDLGRITELAFSTDSKSLVVGDSDGRIGIYHVRAKVDLESPPNLATAF
ncbi:WD40/YVTN repeat-like-containing domain protein [Metarhizium album ARSEF 1941]|uniref:WD40/YVTN repeat-like-containing domain protein n=1 Tax=Metarhizium album (strain ARSEF 1941) TaxID=1081103 RepID=A0A0B2WFV3_METAS|nr:WD40/YVTN repeat-like-containing domain protein [Metarhizium album ARSEF 1941]KHN94836.1 WD40/YVTN repeat-like-containing domain protein [Metarhizium album ARSEF 1941]